MSNISFIKNKDYYILLFENMEHKKILDRFPSLF